MSEKKAIKIFIASSKELKAERDRVILILYKLNKAFPNLHLEPVMWEYDMPYCSYPSIQDALS